ncbi:MAG: hypothetical protein M3O55_02255 [Actinomycetota bacterium]|nr:hypothetical protein [Actinomycetota bacterium]
MTFTTGNKGELVGIYRDTIGDMALSLTGSFLGAVLIATVLWPRTTAALPT